MTARAAVHCRRDSGGANRLSRLRSEGQFVLRPTHPKEPEPWAHGASTPARVSVSAGTAGPLGGDQLHLEIVVGAGAELVLNDVSATLALPGTRAHQSRMTFGVHLEQEATLIWMPEPVIAARACDHLQDISIQMAATSRLYVREELVVGRHGEEPGNVAQRLRVERGGTSLFDQTLRLGQRYPGWSSPAVTDGRRSIGTMLVVDPHTLIGHERADLIDADTASVGIAPDAVVASTVASDHLALARSFDRALALIGTPWNPSRRPEP